MGKRLDRGFQFDNDEMSIPILEFRSTNETLSLLENGKENGKYDGVLYFYKDAEAFVVWDLTKSNQLLIIMACSLLRMMAFG